MTRKGTLVEHENVLWIESRDGSGATFRTEPGWTGPLKVWKARRYAKQNDIALPEEATVMQLAYPSF